jgi:hypothetical protein
LTVTRIAAFVGVALAAAAYLPQIWHLVRVRCAAGISRSAFRTWFVASVLITSHAVATRAGVFIALGLVQTLATGVILMYAARYAASDCGGHGSRHHRATPLRLVPAAGVQSPARQVEVR